MIKSEIKIDDIEIVLSYLSLREIAELIANLHTSIEELISDRNKYIKLYFKIYKNKVKNA